MAKSTRSFEVMVRDAFDAMARDRGVPTGTLRSIIDEMDEHLGDSNRRLTREEERIRERVAAHPEADDEEEEAERKRIAELEEEARKDVNKSLEAQEKARQKAERERAKSADQK